jgi:hypothetical protein
LIVHGINDDRQTEIHTAEPLVPELSAFELAIEKLKSHKSPGIDHIPAELIKAGSRIIRYEIHKLINPIWNKEKLSKEWKEYLSIRRAIQKIVVSLLPTTYKILSNILLSR